MRMATCVALAIVVLATPLLAQEEAVEQRDFGAAVRSQELQEQIELYRQMGMDEEEATFFAMMASGDMDASQMMMLMMMDGGGGGDGMGMFMLMNAMSQGKGTAPPVVIDRGETLLIVEGGTLYKINPETMEIVGQLKYAKKAGGMGAMLPWLMFGQTVEHMEEATLAVAEEVDEAKMDLKQLSLAALMYAQDWDETFPGETWAEDIFDYVKDEEKFRRADAPGLGVGYAMNEKLSLASMNTLATPASTVLLFESEVGGDNPLGGADDVPPEGLHNGMIYVAFTDGHVENVTVERARELLEQDPFR